MQGQRNEESHHSRFGQFKIGPLSGNSSVTVQSSHVLVLHPNQEPTIQALGILGQDARETAFIV